MISILALFCEDIRLEASGQHTLVGILPDHIETPSLPGMMPKLAVYIRAEFDSQTKPNNITVRFVDDGGNDIMQLPNWDAGTISGAQKEAQAQGSPIYGLIITALNAPFRLAREGILKVVAEVDGATHIAGILNIKASSSGSLPPS